jgi:hypothetical protein
MFSVEIFRYNNRHAYFWEITGVISHQLTGGMAQ